MNRTIQENSMLSHAVLLDGFWAEALMTIVHLINRSPNHAIDHGILEEIWIGKTPSYDHLSIFGREPFVHVPKELQKKLDSWSHEFSEDYLDWISPMFSGEKARHFDAYWRSARQQLLQFHHKLSTQQDVEESDLDETRGILFAMMHKADKELLALAESLGRSLRVRDVRIGR